LLCDEPREGGKNAVWSFGHRSVTDKKLKTLSIVNDENEGLNGTSSLALVSSYKEIKGVFS